MGKMKNPGVNPAGVHDLGYSLVRFSHTAEAASDNLTAGRDDDEGIRIDLTHSVAKLNGFHSFAYRVDHGFLFLGELTHNGIDGNAVAKILHNIRRDLLSFGRDHDEILAGIEAFDNAIHDECFGKQSKQGEKSRLHIEHHKSAGRHKEIHRQQSLAHVNADIFLQNKSDNVRAAG